MPFAPNGGFQITDISSLHIHQKEGRRGRRQKKLESRSPREAMDACGLKKQMVGQRERNLGGNK